MSLQNEISKISSNALWQILEKAVRVVAGFVIGALVAKHLGPADFGLLSAAWAAFALAAPMVVGLDTLFIREMASRTSEEGSLIGVLGLFKAVIGLVVYLVPLVVFGLMVGGGEIEGNRQLLVMAIIGAHLVSQPLDAIIIWYYANDRAKIPNICVIAALVIASVARVVGVGYMWNVEIFAIIVFGEMLLGRLLVVMFFFREKRRIKMRFPVAEIKSLMREGWPAIAAGFAASIYLNADLIMVRLMIGEDASGVYAAATRVSMMFFFLPGILARAVLPSLVRLKERGDAEIGEGLRDYCSASSMMAYGSVACGSVLGIVAIPLLYGAAYTGATSILLLHMWCVLPLFLGSVRRQWMQVNGWMKQLLAMEVVGTVTNILLNLILIPKFGVHGAAVSTLVAISVSVFATTRFFDPMRPLADTMVAAIRLAGAGELIRKIRARNVPLTS